MVKNKEKPKVLSKAEEDLLNALKGADTVGLAAEKIGISRGRANNLLFALRKKYARARLLVNKIDGAKKYHLVDLVLTPNRMHYAKSKPVEETKEPDEGELSPEEEALQDTMMAIGTDR